MRPAVSSASDLDCPRAPIQMPFEIISNRSAYTCTCISKITTHTSNNSTNMEILATVMNSSMENPSKVVEDGYSLFSNSRET